MNEKDQLLLSEILKEMKDIRKSVDHTAEKLHSIDEKLELLCKQDTDRSNLPEDRTPFHASEDPIETVEKVNAEETDEQRLKTIISNQLSHPDYEQWIKPLDFIFDHERQTVVISCEDPFTLDWVASRFENVIIQSINDITGIEYDVVYNNNPYLFEGDE